MTYYQVDVSFKSKSSILVEAENYSDAEKVVAESVNKDVENFIIEQITELTEEEKNEILGNIQETQKDRVLN